MSGKIIIENMNNFIIQLITENKDIVQNTEEFIEFIMTDHIQDKIKEFIKNILKKEQKDKCPYVLTKGKNKEKNYGRKIKNGLTYCSLHKNYEGYLPEIVKQMKLSETEDKKLVLEKINNEKTLTGKCILSRRYLSPQSTCLETICKTDLGIGNALNATSGDGHKNGINYEIKSSIHAKKSKINFVQIRPDHDIHSYIFLAYNMYENDTIGKAHIFKIPSHVVYDLVLRFGGYAHGSISELGKITSDNIKGRNCEYALRCNPNAKKGKNELWNEFMKYEVEYDPYNF